MIGYTPCYGDADGTPYRWQGYIKTESRRWCGYASSRLTNANGTLSYSLSFLMTRRSAPMQGVRLSSAGLCK
jgi:hypothetical protein